ncbi:monocarboxylate transporter 9-like [Saccostrea echinata]|uniref:monocarboxylate transporter 9-like n=1 Tax=Saccostrea echinata TaxID=191078 RepID=UPI002A7F99B1|nr:monocarboxylate transporter 9-like [Saccostrea echinata]
MARATRVPVDRGWAWMVVLGTFGNMALVVGTLKSFGVLLVELSHIYNVPSSLLASSQSLCGWLHLGLAPVSNNLSQRFSHRWVVFCGGVLSVLGLVATSFVRDIEWFFVTYGVITGLGFGLILAPGLVIPGLYFEKKLPLALGLGSSGSGLGSFIFPNLMRFLLDEYSVSGCLLIMGGIMLHVCLFALLYRPILYWEKKRFTTKKTNYSSKKNSLQHTIEVQYQEEECSALLTIKDGGKGLEIAKANLESASVSGLYETKSLPSLSIIPVRHSMTSSISESNIFSKKNVSDSKFSNSNCTPSLELKGHVQNLEKLPIIDWTMLKNPLFILTNIGLVLAIFAHHNVFNFVPSLADELGFQESEGALCVSIVGITDLIGRISGGIIGNAFFKRRIKLYVICLLIFSTCLMIVVHITYFYVFIIFCGVLGLTTGGYIGVQLSTIADELGRENLSTAWGYIAFFSSFSILINPVLSGAIKDYSGSWKNAFRLSSACGFLGTGVLFTELIVRKHLHKKSEKRSNYIK